MTNRIISMRAMTREEQSAYHKLSVILWVVLGLMTVSFLLGFKFLSFIFLVIAAFFAMKLGKLEGSWQLLTLKLTTKEVRLHGN